MVIFLPTFSDVDYTDPDETPYSSPYTTGIANADPALPNTDLRKCNIFVPDNPKKLGPLPCLVRMNLSGWINTWRVTDVNDTDPNRAVDNKLLERGEAIIVSASCTISDTASGAYAGAGLFHPPGVPSGFWDDPLKPSPEKDCAHLIQYLRENAATYGIDPNAIIGGGESAGAYGMHFAGLGPDLANPGGVGQQQQSTRLNGATYAYMHEYYPSFVQTVTTLVNGNPFSVGTHFPDRTSGPAYETMAPLMEDVDPFWQNLGSVLALEDPSLTPGLADLNAAIPIYCYSDDISTAASQQNITEPTLILDEEFNLHGLLGGLEWKKRRGNKTRLTAATSATSQMGSLMGLIDKSFPESSQLFDVVSSDIADWFVANFGVGGSSVQVGKGYPKAIAEKAVGPSATFTATTADGNWTLLVPPNKARRSHVMVYAATVFAGTPVQEFSNSFYVGTADEEGDLLATGPIVGPLSSTALRTEYRVPGNGGVWVQRTATNVSAFAEEY